MPFKFNPFTGTLDLVDGTGTDHHGGYSLIPSSANITVELYKIMFSYLTLTVEGTLTILGDVVIL